MELDKIPKSIYNGSQNGPSQQNKKPVLKTEYLCTSHSLIETVHKLCKPNLRCPNPPPPFVSDYQQLANPPRLLCQHPSAWSKPSSQMADNVFFLIFFYWIYMKCVNLSIFLSKWYTFSTSTLHLSVSVFSVFVIPPFLLNLATDIICESSKIYVPLCFRKNHSLFFDFDQENFFVTQIFKCLYVKNHLFIKTKRMLLNKSWNDRTYIFMFVEKNIWP